MGDDNFGAVVGNGLSEDKILNLRCERRAWQAKRPGGTAFCSVKVLSILKKWVKINIARTYGAQGRLVGNEGRGGSREITHLLVSHG